MMYMKTLILIVAVLSPIRQQVNKLDKTTLMRFVSIMEDNKELMNYFPASAIYFKFDQELMTEDIKGDHYYATGTVSVWTRDKIFESNVRNWVVIGKYKSGNKTLFIDYYVDGGPDRGALYKDKIKIRKL